MVSDMRNPSAKNHKAIWILSSLLSFLLSTAAYTHVNVFLRINFVSTTSAGKVRYVALYPFNHLSIHPSTNDT